MRDIGTSLMSLEANAVPNENPDLFPLLVSHKIISHCDTEPASYHKSSGTFS